MKKYTKVVAIDPGNIQSAFVVWDGKAALAYGILSNEDMEGTLMRYKLADESEDWFYVIEKVACYGMAVGESVFDTVFATGRFSKCIEPYQSYRIPRGAVKMHFCHSMRAKDGNIIQALKDRYEPDLMPRQRPKGILKGLSKDCWQALALAVYCWDMLSSPQAEIWQGELKK